MQSPSSHFYPLHHHLSFLPPDVSSLLSRLQSLTHLIRSKFWGVIFLFSHILHCPPSSFVPKIFLLSYISSDSSSAAITAQVSEQNITSSLITVLETFTFKSLLSSPVSSTLNQFWKVLIPAEILVFCNFFITLSFTIQCVCVGPNQGVLLRILKK